MTAMERRLVQQLVTYACQPLNCAGETRELALQRRMLRTKELAVILANKLGLDVVDYYSYI